MFVFIAIENPEYQFALSNLHRLQKYYACTTVGNLDGIVQKGSRLVVAGTCPVDYFRKDVTQQITLGGYKCFTASLDELNVWAESKGQSIGKEVKEISEAMQKGGWTEKTQSMIIFHAKHFAYNMEFFQKKSPEVS